MDYNYSTTTTPQKGSHLTYDERVLIQIRLKDGLSKRAIARELGRSPSTICNEIKRGSVSMYNGHVVRYKPNEGQNVYERNRLASHRTYQSLNKSRFIKYVETHFFADNWSLDACYGRAISNGLFTKDQMVCVKTLYNYVDLGLLSIKPMDLPEKLKRNTKKARVRKNKRNLGRSIDERPEEVQSRETFGHWECDLVIGSKKKDDNVLLTLLERKTREFMVIPIANKEATTVIGAFKELQKEYSEHFSDVFKTITTDNGSEFASLTEIESMASTLVYYAHPYTSCDKGSVERHNGIIRRFIPKGKRIDDFTSQAIADIETWCNCLPRKILSYKTPDELFEKELDKIYQIKN